MLHRHRARVTADGWEGAADRRGPRPEAGPPDITQKYDETQALMLAGGSGTRFWPLSRQSRPSSCSPSKGSDRCCAPPSSACAPGRAGGRLDLHHRAPSPTPCRRELPEVPPEQVLAEPKGRNTAPAIGWAVASMPDAARQGVVAVLPADHRIGDAAAFRAPSASAPPRRRSAKTAS